MNLEIYPVEGKSEIIREYYSQHEPFYSGDAGIDLYCVEDVLIPAKSVNKIISFGFRAVPKKKNTAIALFVLPRSSTALRTPIRVTTVDIRRGHGIEISVVVNNISDEDFTLKKGERYFQLCSSHLLGMKVKIVEKSGYFDICPVEGKEEVINSYYSERQDLLDKFRVYCTDDIVIPAKSYGVFVPFGFKGSAFLNEKPISYFLVLCHEIENITLSNTIGIIDSGYRGEIKAIVDNESDSDILLMKGKVYFFLKCVSPDEENAKVMSRVIKEIDTTKRGVSGFGSTNISRVTYSV